MTRFFLVLGLMMFLNVIIGLQLVPVDDRRLRKLFQRKYPTAWATTSLVCLAASALIVMR